MTHPKTIRTCIDCGGPITRGSLVGRCRACSSRHTAKQNARQVPVTCAACGAIFTIKQSLAGKRRFCSPECRTRRVMRTCPTCGETSLVAPSRLRELHCSKRCADIAGRGPLPEPPNPSGLCMCGCGEPAPIAEKSHRKNGVLQGHPKRFIKGHHAVKYIGPAYIVDERTGCWNWQRSFSDDGYGLSGGTTAHRVIYRRLTSRNIDGLHLHHRCENTRCVNPAHLEEMTPGEHTRLTHKGKPKKRKH